MAVVEDIMQTRLRLVGLGAWTGAWSTAGAATRMFARAQDEAANSAGQLAAKSLLATSAAGALAGVLVRATQEAGKMQRLGTAFETVAGGASNAAAEVNELRKTTAARLFGDETVIRGAIGLRNMGASAKEASGWIETLGNVTAGSAGGQQGFATSLNVVSRAIEEQRISGRELMQMQRMGIPIQQILAEKMGITAQAVHTLDLEGPAAARALHMIQDGLNQRYAGAMARDMNTLDGALDALGNTAQRSGTILGGPFMSAGSTVARMVTGMLEAFNNAPQPIKDTASAAGVILVGALGAVGKRLAVAAAETAILARETIQLANAHLRAADGARMQAAAEGTLGATVGRQRARGASSGMIGTFGGSATAAEKEETAAMNAIFGHGAMNGEAAAVKPGFLKRFGTPLAFGGLIAGDLALNLLPDQGEAGMFKRVGNRTLEGAGLGLMFGPEGALIGGAAGAVLGGAEEAFRKPGGGDKTQEQILAALQQANEINQKQLNTMELMRQGGPMDPAVIPISLQTQVLNSAYGR